MTTFLEAYPDGAGRGALAPAPAEHIDAIVLAGGEAQAHPAPVGYGWALFSFTHDVFVRFGDATVTVAMPAASTSDGAAGELNPAARRIPVGATHIGLISPEGCAGSIAFYR